MLDYNVIHFGLVNRHWLILHIFIYITIGVEGHSAISAIHSGFGFPVLTGAAEFQPLLIIDDRLLLTSYCLSKGSSRKSNISVWPETSTKLRTLFFVTKTWKAQLFVQFNERQNKKKTCERGSIPLRFTELYTFFPGLRNSEECFSRIFVCRLVWVVDIRQRSFEGDCFGVKCCVSTT